MAVNDAMPCYSQAPLSSPAGSSGCVLDASPPPHTHSALRRKQVRVAPHTQTPLRAAVPSESGPCIPSRCPTPGTSVVPLIPLARSLEAWLTLPSPSRWLIRTIRLRLCDSVRPAPPCFQGHSVHPCSGGQCPCSQGGDHSPTGERHDRASPSSRYEDRLLQPVLHCTQERR